MVGGGGCCGGYPIETVVYTYSIPIPSSLLVVLNYGPGEYPFIYI